MAHPHDSLLQALLNFVHDEQAAAARQLSDVWSRPIGHKLQAGVSQAFTRLEPAHDAGTLWAWLDDGDSRFREGDLMVLHEGSPLESCLARALVLESEEDDRWLLRGHRASALLQTWSGSVCFADPDTMDLTPYYERSLKEIRESRVGREVVLPLLADASPIVFDDRDVADAEAAARRHGLDRRQAEAVGLAVGAEQLACIQGPPGTGKTRVLALIVRLMVERGERVLVTSHTHMAIHNALNKVAAQGVPVAKVGRPSQRKGLDAAIACHPTMDDWIDRPTNGYVVGATPFATCTARLEQHEFDTIVFDEASQITMPLALMAMRKGRKFIFIGDQKQLPPVLLSRSVLDKDAPSVFARLTARSADHTVMLERTYRMSQSLTEWPSRTYYGGRLTAAGANRERRLALAPMADRMASVFDPTVAGVFVPTLERTARTFNLRDAELVVDLCAAAAGAGLGLEAIGIVTPYRAQGRAIRDRLARRFGRDAARAVVADTVERMQGQEREMIILSLATGDPRFLDAVAPFFFQPERLNVSITRAISKLVVIGPLLESTPAVEHATLRRWIDQYRDLVRHLKRIDL